MSLNLDLDKVFKAAKAAVEDKPSARLELDNMVNWW